MTFNYVLYMFCLFISDAYFPVILVTIVQLPKKKTFKYGVNKHFMYLQIVYLFVIIFEVHY